MSLLDMAGKLMGGGQTGGNSALLSTVLAMINNHPGGLNGVIQSFQQQGLGGVVNSWVGTGPNEPVSGQQVESALGSEQVEDVASKMGVSKQDASSTLAQLLPQLVDHLTPNGQIPQNQGSLLEMGESLLKRFSK